MSPSRLFRIAACAVDAKIAFRSSPNTVVRIRAAPSDFSSYRGLAPTASNPSSRQNPYGRVFGDRDIQAIHDLLEKEWDLNIEDFASDEQSNSSEDTCFD